MAQNMLNIFSWVLLAIQNLKLCFPVHQKSCHCSGDLLLFYYYNQRYLLLTMNHSSLGQRSKHFCLNLNHSLCLVIGHDFYFLAPSGAQGVKDILVISLNHISTQIISILNIILKSKVWFHQSVCSITKSVVLLLSFSSQKADNQFEQLQPILMMK